MFVIYLLSKSRLSPPENNHVHFVMWCTLYRNESIFFVWYYWHIYFITKYTWSDFPITKSYIQHRLTLWCHQQRHTILVVIRPGWHCFHWYSWYPQLIYHCRLFSYNISHSPLLIYYIKWECWLRIFTYMLISGNNSEFPGL